MNKNVYKNNWVYFGFFLSGWQLAEERGRHPPSAGALGSWKSLALCEVKTYAEK